MILILFLAPAETAAPIIAAPLVEEEVEPEPIVLDPMDVMVSCVLLQKIYLRYAFAANTLFIFSFYLVLYVICTI